LISQIVNNIENTGIIKNIINSNPPNKCIMREFFIKSFDNLGLKYFCDELEKVDLLFNKSIFIFESNKEYDKFSILLYSFWTLFVNPIKGSTVNSKKQCKDFVNSILIELIENNDVNKNRELIKFLNGNSIVIIEKIKNSKYDDAKLESIVKNWINCLIMVIDSCKDTELDIIFYDVKKIKDSIL
jgi:hypothetical protein